MRHWALPRSRTLYRDESEWQSGIDEHASERSDSGISISGRPEADSGRTTRKIQCRPHGTHPPPHLRAGNAGRGIRAPVLSDRTKRKLAILWDGLREKHDITEQDVFVTSVSQPSLQNVRRPARRLQALGQAYRRCWAENSRSTCAGGGTRRGTTQQRATQLRGCSHGGARRDQRCRMALLPPPRWPGGAARATERLRCTTANCARGRAAQFGALLGRRSAPGSTL